MPDNLIIRPQIVGQSPDYQALAALYQYAYPEESSTATGLRLSDNSRSLELVCQRWFAEQDGIIIGVGGFEHWEAYYQPDKYLLHLIVEPSSQNQGVGAALYHYVIEQLEKRQPHFVRTWVQQKRERSILFAERRGFTKIKLKWNIRLDLKPWNRESFAGQIAIVQNEGIEVKALSQFDNNLDHQRKLYELYLMTLQSIESADDAKTPNFEEFINQISQSSDELTFIALHDKKYVGMWQLENESVSSLFGGIMAVDVDYRRRGAALALAVHGIAQAKFFQYKTLTVHTDEFNKAILALTEKMGFTHLPASLFFSKQYKSQA